MAGGWKRVTFHNYAGDGGDRRQKTERSDAPDSCARGPNRAQPNLDDGVESAQTANPKVYSAHRKSRVRMRPDGPLLLGAQDTGSGRFGG